MDGPVAVLYWLIDSKHPDVGINMAAWGGKRKERGRERGRWLGNERREITKNNKNQQETDVVGQNGPKG